MSLRLFHGQTAFLTRRGLAYTRPRPLLGAEAVWLWALTQGLHQYEVRVVDPAADRESGDGGLVLHILRGRLLLPREGIDPVLLDYADRRLRQSLFYADGPAVSAPQSAAEPDVAALRAIVEVEDPPPDGYRSWAAYHADTARINEAEMWRGAGRPDVRRML